MVANWAYRMLLRRVAERCDDEADRQTLWQAEIFQALNFERVDPSQRTRLARAVARGAEELRLELLAHDDALDQEFAAYLAVLARDLHEEFG